MDTTSVELNGHTVARILIDPDGSDSTRDYGIFLERRCPLTGGWFTAEGESAVYGYSWTGEGSFEAEVRRNAEARWNLEAQPLSEAGARLQERRKLDGLIGEKMEAYYSLVGESTPSPKDALALEVFAHFLDLNEEYMLEIDALETS